MKKVSVVIPNWDGEELLKICLPSLKTQSFKNFETIIIDNGSKDNSLNFINKNYPEIKVIQNPKNLGFAKAVNQGIKESKGDYIFLLNNDTKLDKKCIKNLTDCLKKYPNISMVAAKMLQFNNPNLIDSAGDWIDAVGHANNIGFGKNDEEGFTKGKEIFLVTGGGSIFRKEIFNEVGLFDEDYFAYFEDVDFCLRAQFLGFKAYFEPSAKIYHIHKASSKRKKEFFEYLQFRNMTMTILKDFPKKLLLHDLNFLKIFLVNLNTIRFFAKNGLLKEALKAEWYIIKNLKKILEKRKAVQSNIKVPQDYIIKNIKPKKITFFGLLKNGI